MRVCRQKNLNDFFLGKWKLMSDLDYKLTNCFQVGLREEFLNVALNLLELLFLEGDKALAH